MCSIEARSLFAIFRFYHIYSSDKTGSDYFQSQNSDVGNKMLKWIYHQHYRKHNGNRPGDYENNGIVLLTLHPVEAFRYLHKRKDSPKNTDYYGRAAAADNNCESNYTV